MFFRALVLAVTTLGLVIPAHAITRSWTGTASALWSNPANWSPAGVPAPEDSLVFPQGTGRPTMTNDLPAGTVVGPMYFAESYTLNGNALTLTGNLTFNQSVSNYFVANAPFTLGANVTLGAAVISDYNGAIDVNGHTLTVASYNTTLAGAVNGTGAISVSFPGSRITNGGMFSGTITGMVDVAGSMPNAAIHGLLTGNGTVGAIHISNRLSPGSKNPSYTDDPHSVGTIHSQSAILGGQFLADLVPGGASDQLDVTGTVTLSSPTLQLSVAGGAIGPDQSFTIISNDGSDPVSGTFSGLAEGAQIAVAGGTLAITYLGGDGNDVVLNAVGAQKTWTGASSASWSNAGNWSPAGIPAVGEALVFPAGVSRTAMVNDLPAGTAVGAMDFRASYTLSGNALTLTGDLTFDQSVNPHMVFNTPFLLGTSVRLGAAITSTYNGAIDVGGHTLTIDTYNTTVHALLGTGAIVVNSAGLRIAASGTFDGTITGNVDLQGLLPNADITGGVSGNGTAGAIHVHRPLYLGAKDPSITADPHALGTLRTASATIAGAFHVDLAFAGASDQLIVAGGVTLSNAALHLSVVNGSIGEGQSFVLIDNDGTDPVNGTFASLPENATIALPGATVTISYYGGDGNDVVVFAGSATRSWTGATNALWSNPDNWSPAAIPGPGESLIFPAGASHRSMTNDLEISVGAMDFRDSYTLNGNALTLGGNVTIDASSFVSNAPLILGADVHIGGALTNIYNGAIDVNGHTLTIDSHNTLLAGPLDGAGAVKITGSGATLSGGGTFAGTINGIINILGSIPNATLAGGLMGNGSLGAVTIASTLRPGKKHPAYSDDPHTRGTIETQSLTIDSGQMFVDVFGDGTSDRVDVTGAITLGNVTLGVSVPGGSPLAGTTFTIIENDGTDPVAGTFLELEERALFTTGPWMFRITYAGGDGNDVVLTAIEPTEVQAAQQAASTRFGETATITVRVVARAGTPNGDVTFTDNGDVLKTVPLVNGEATLRATFEPGVYALAATYDGTDEFAPSSSSLTHVVARGQTTSDVTAFSAPVVYGDPVEVSLQVSAIAPAAGTPGGEATIGGRNVTLANGAASASLLLDAGTHAIAAAYAGDTRFDGSTGSAQVTVLTAPTLTAATLADNMLTITVSAPHRASLAVTGMVTVTGNGAVLAQQPIDGNTAVVHLGAMATGDHLLDVSFLGSNNFESSSTSIVFTAGPPQISIRDVAVLEGGEEKNVTVFVELSSPGSDVVTVVWTTEDGTATSGTDYKAASGTINFAAGEVTKTISITVLGDAKPENDETFIVRLSSAVSADVAVAAAGVKIVNDDLSYRAQYGIVYAPGLTLDLYTPSEGTGPFPLIVWVPGTTAYDAAGSEPAALRATGRGFAVAVVRYRTPSVAKFPAQLDDLRSAIRWLRGNALSMNLDTTRIAAWGTSAGAHLASLLGTMNGDGGAGALSSSVQAVIAWGGASDLTLLQSDAMAGGCPATFDDRSSAQSQLIGCALPSCTPSAIAASPLTHVTTDDVPFLILHTRNDCVVPAAQSTRFYNALRAAGVKATLRPVDAGTVQGYEEIDAFLDAQLPPRTGKRRAVR